MRRDDENTTKIQRLADVVCLLGIAACKANPTPNLKDIILIHRCLGQYSFEDLTLDISGKLIQ